MIIPIIFGWDETVNAIFRQKVSLICLDHRRANKDFKIRRLRTTGYGWTRVFRCLGYWAEYTTNGAKIQS